MWGPAPPVSTLDVVFEGRLEAAATFVMVPQAAAELLRPAGAEQSQERCRNLEFEMLVHSQSPPGQTGLRSGTDLWISGAV